MRNEGDPLPDIKNYPILNQQEAARIFEATFQKDCGENDICESDLQVYAHLNLSGLYFIFKIAIIYIFLSHLFVKRIVICSNYLQCHLLNLIFTNYFLVRERK